MVQEKIKQMIATRKRIASKGTPTQIKRLKSNFQSEDHMEEYENQKPKSSISQRLHSARKSKNMEAHSNTTDSSNKNDINVVRLIDDVFDKSFDLGKYFNRKNLNPE